MVYRVRSRTARATQRSPVFKTKQTNKKQSNKKTKIHGWKDGSAVSSEEHALFIPRTRV